MDEIERTRRFRDGVAGPDAAARSRADARVAQAIARGVVIRTSSRRRAPRLALSGAMGVTAVAGVVALVAPWDGGPDIVARAAAALSPPEGKIVHLTISGSPTSGDIAGTESWSTTSAPFNSRTILDGNLGTSATETSGTGLQSEWSYDRATNTVHKVIPAKGRPAINLPSSPAEMLLAAPRQLLESGDAYNDGSTEINGKPVYKITTKDGFVTGGTPDLKPQLVLYVDRNTYLPVAQEGSFLHNGKRVASRVNIDVRYLPATPENVALTSVRAQHPNATVGTPVADVSGQVVKVVR